MEDKILLQEDPLLLELTRTLLSVCSGVGFTFILENYIVSGKLIALDEYCKLMDEDLTPRTPASQRGQQQTRSDNAQPVYDESTFVHLRDVSIFSGGLEFHTPHVRICICNIKGWTLACVYSYVGMDA